jgi:hypothetical protein
MVHESLRKMTAHTLQDRLALVTKVFGGRCGEAASSVSAASNDRPSTATAAFRPERPYNMRQVRDGNTDRTGHSRISQLNWPPKIYTDRINFPLFLP